MSNSSGVDMEQKFVGHDLDPKCLQRYLSGLSPGMSSVSILTQFLVVYIFSSPGLKAQDELL